MSDGADLPTSFEALKALILLRHRSLPKRLAQVARFALDHPDDIAFGTAASVAAASGVQPSTLVRLAQSLGFQGYSEMQALFRNRLRGRTASYDDRLAGAKVSADGSAGGALAVAGGVLEAARRSLDTVARELDGEALERAAQMLAGAQTIYVLAQRRSYPAASYLGYLFGKLRMRAVVAGMPSGADEDALSLAEPGDVGLVVSFTPYAPATLDWTRLLIAGGIPVVGVTDSAFSPVAQLSSVWLEVAEADFEGFRSLSATMALSVTLAVAAAKVRRARRVAELPLSDALA